MPQRKTPTLLNTICVDSLAAHLACKDYAKSTLKLPDPTKLGIDVAALIDKLGKGEKVPCSLYMRVIDLFSSDCIRSLDFSKVIDSAPLMLSTFTNLESLTLTHANVEEGSIYIRMVHCPRLKHLRLDGVEVNNEILLYLAKMKTLTRLSITNARMVTIGGMRGFCIQMKTGNRLELLDIDISHLGESEEIAQTILRRCPNIEHINLGHRNSSCLKNALFQLQFTNPREIKTFPNVKEIVLDWDMGSIDLDLLSWLPNLKHLTLNMTNAVSARVTALDQLPNMAHLTELTLNCIIPLPFEQSAAVILKYFGGNLHHLKVTGTSNFKLDVVAQHCPNLETMTLSTNGFLSSSTPVNCELTTGFKNLFKLVLCSQRSSCMAYFDYVFTSSPILQEICFRSMHSLNYDAFLSSAGYSAVRGHLACLSFRGCSRPPATFVKRLIEDSRSTLSTLVVDDRVVFTAEEVNSFKEYIVEHNLDLELRVSDRLIDTDCEEARLMLREIRRTRDQEARRRILGDMSEQRMLNIKRKDPLLWQDLRRVMTWDTRQGQDSSRRSVVFGSGHLHIDPRGLFPGDEDSYHELMWQDTHPRWRRNPSHRHMMMDTDRLPLDSSSDESD